MIDLTELVGSFAALLQPREDNSARLDAWIAAVRAADLPHLHTFARDLELDYDAVQAAVTMPYHNGGTEGVNTKPKGSCARCTAVPDSPFYATESSSTEVTHSYHRKSARAVLLAVP